jgi:hypothetical protein
MKPLTNPKVQVKAQPVKTGQKPQAPKAQAQCCAKVSRIVAGCHD